MKSTSKKFVFLIFIKLFLIYSCVEEKIEEPIFKTNEFPGITTDSIYDITNKVAVCSATIHMTGFLPIDSAGVCWSNSQNPNITDNHTNDGSGIGSFTSQLTGLTEGTTYYVRAYATNSVGTAYGGEKSFVHRPPSGTFTDSRDGHTYE